MGGRRVAEGRAVGARVGVLGARVGIGASVGRGSGVGGTRVKVGRVVGRGDWVGVGPARARNSAVRQLSTANHTMLPSAIQNSGEERR